MQLKEFITTTLVQIAEGMDAASKSAGHQFKITTDSKSASSYIEFDVAVTSADEKKGKASISVWAFGVRGSKAKKNQNVNRLKFKVLYRGKKKVGRVTKV
ncbi:MAG: hypothetical protein WC289_02690 [Patescibacteria group bacterium]|jgi:hypothetical protein